MIISDRVSYAYNQTLNSKLLEFVSLEEEISTYVLFGFVSFLIFLITAFIEILERHNEILFISRKHKYNKKDFILPCGVGVFVFLLFFGVGNNFYDLMASIPQTPIDCGLGSDCHNKELAQLEARKEFINFITSWGNPKP